MARHFLFISIGFITACSASLDFGDSNRFEADATDDVRPVMRNAQIQRDTNPTEPRDMELDRQESDVSDLDISQEDVGTQDADAGVEMDGTLTHDSGATDAQPTMDTNMVSDANEPVPDQELDEGVDADLGAESADRGPMRKDPIREGN